MITYCLLVYCYRSMAESTTLKLWPLPYMDSDPDYPNLVYDSFNPERYLNRIFNRTTTVLPPPCMDPVAPDASLCEDMHPPGYRQEQLTTPKYRINPYWFTDMKTPPPFPKELHISVCGVSANHTFRRFMLQVRINDIPAGKMLQSHDTVLVNCVPGVNNTLVYNGYSKICFKFVYWIPPRWYNITQPRWTPVIHLTLIKKPGIYWRMTKNVHQYRPTPFRYRYTMPPSAESMYDSKLDYLSMSRTYYDKLKREREEEEREKAAEKKT